MCTLKKLILFLITIVTVSEAFANSTEISVALYDLPPHVIAEGKEPQGSIPEFLNKFIFNDSSWKPRWRVNQFSRIIKDLESDRVDMAVLVAKTPEREGLVEFSEVPIYKTRSGIIVKKDSKLTRIDSLEPLRGMKLGHDLGSVVPQYFKESGVDFVFLSGEDYFKRNLQLLRAGRVDGVFAPTWSHASYELRGSSEFTILEVPEGALDLYVVFRKNLNPEFVKYVNKILKTQKSEYLKTLKKWYTGATYVRKDVTSINR